MLIDRCHDCHSSRQKLDYTIHALELHQLPASSRWTIPAVCIRRNAQSLNRPILLLRVEVFSTASIDILAKPATTVSTPFFNHVGPVKPDIFFDRVDVDKSRATSIPLIIIFTATNVKNPPICHVHETDFNPAMAWRGELLSRLDFLPRLKLKSKPLCLTAPYCRLKFPIGQYRVLAYLNRRAVQKGLSQGQLEARKLHSLVDVNDVPSVLFLLCLDEQAQPVGPKVHDSVGSANCDVVAKLIAQLSVDTFQGLQERQDVVGDAVARIDYPALRLGPRNGIRWRHLNMTTLFTITAVYAHR